MHSCLNFENLYLMESIIPNDFTSDYWQAYLSLKQGIILAINSWKK